MADIDWSKAPEGATHFRPAQGSLESALWVRMSGDTVLKIGYPGQGWALEYDRHSQPETDFSCAIKRPEPWSGEWLPPVGTICEIHYKNRDWVKCEIVAHKTFDCGAKPHAIAWIDGDTLDQSQGLRFRPIRTPEQIAAEQIENEIKAAMEMINKTTMVPGDQARQNIARHVVETMIKGGYRKFEITDE